MFCLDKKSCIHLEKLLQKSKGPWELISKQVRLNLLSIASWLDTNASRNYFGIKCLFKQHEIGYKTWQLLSNNRNNKYQIIQLKKKVFVFRIVKTDIHSLVLHQVKSHLIFLLFFFCFFFCLSFYRIIFLQEKYLHMSKLFFGQISKATAFMTTSNILINVHCKFTNIIVIFVT